MHYIVESEKSFYEACFDIEPVIQRLGFALAGVLDLTTLLQGREHEPDEDCRVFQIVNPRLMETLVGRDMRLSLQLPWRISVFTENGATRIGMLRLSAMPDQEPGDGELNGLLAEIDARLMQIIDETR